jgi:hypothetical protein
MYAASFVLELVEKWRDPFYGWCLVLLYAAFVLSGVPLSGYLAFLAAANAYEMTFRFPAVPNHVNLAIFINALQLAVAAHAVVMDGRLPSRQISFERIRPVIGLSVALTYFFAGFHKLNSDFFDYEAGCTHTFMLTILQFYHLPVVDHGNGWDSSHCCQHDRGSEPQWCCFNQ